jgi:hypothetical protein
MKRELDEPILEDSYPIYADYLYMADGKVVRSDWHGITVRQLKAHLGAKEIRRYDFLWAATVVGIVWAIAWCKVRSRDRK